MLMKKTLTLAIALAATLSLQAQNRSDLPDLSTIISSQPEGTLHKDVNHYFEGCYVYPSDGSIYDYFADGCVADLVEADDGSLYIKNPFGFFSVDDAEVWVKAVKAADGNGYEVHLPQAVYDNQGGCVKTLLFLKNHKALTFTSQGFAMSKSCCNFRP